MWRARVPTENWAGPQAPEGAGPGRTWSFLDGVRAGSGRAGRVMAPSSSHARPPGALLAHGQDNRYGTGAVFDRDAHKQAFELLTRLSQTTHRKLRDCAANLVTSTAGDRPAD